MIYSMTGYAIRTRPVHGGTLHIELKSVNSRYLDCILRVCDELRAAEPAIRELIGTGLSRGKVECRVGFVAAATTDQPPTLNADLVERLRILESQVRSVLPSAAPLTVSEVLRWPGIVGDESLDVDSLLPECLAGIAEALDDFNASRVREGDKLGRVIRERVERMRVLLREVEPRIPAAQSAFRERLRQRLLDAFAAADEERIRQEVAVFAVRIDIAEELTRLETHLDEVERILEAGGTCGKRLDFLMQELNREANTLGSKSLMAEVSQTAIDFKLLIEQMREQVQNLE